MLFQGSFSFEVLVIEGLVVLELPCLADLGWLQLGDQSMPMDCTRDIYPSVGKTLSISSVR